LVTILFYPDPATNDLYTHSLHDALPISRGLEKELLIPNFSSKLKKVSAFIGLPLSECSTRGAPLIFSLITAFFTSVSACFASSCSQTSQPTTFLLNKSRIK